MMDTILIEIFDVIKFLGALDTRIRGSAVLGPHI